MVNAIELQRLGIGIEWVPALNDTFARWGIATPKQQAAFTKFTNFAMPMIAARRKPPGG